MPKQAAKQWIEKYSIRRINGHPGTVIEFHTAKELSDFKAKYAQPGEDHAAAIARTAKEIGAKRGVRAIYSVGSGRGSPAMLLFTK